MKSKVPWITLLVIAPALVIAASPVLQGLLIYDREGILRGQFWRIFTSHWVHFSTTHLWADLLAFAVAGWICESSGVKGFGILCLLAPVVIGGGLLAFAPNLQIFAGLSGLAMTAVTAFGVNGLRHSGKWKWVSAATLIGVVAKITADCFRHESLFLPFTGAPIQISIASHVLGALAGALFVGACFWLESPAKQSRSENPDHSR